MFLMLMYLVYSSVEIVPITESQKSGTIINILTASLKGYRNGSIYAASNLQ